MENADNKKPISITIFQADERITVEYGGLTIVHRPLSAADRLRIASCYSQTGGNLALADYDALVRAIAKLIYTIDGPQVPEKEPATDTTEAVLYTPLEILQSIDNARDFLGLAGAVTGSSILTKDQEKK